MVTEKDLYHMMEIQCSGTGRYSLYYYDLINQSMILQESGEIFTDYNPQNVLDGINKYGWKILNTKEKIYELW